VYLLCISANETILELQNPQLGTIAELCLILMHYAVLDAAAARLKCDSGIWYRLTAVANESIYLS
jgi:ABC-type Fe3+-citrate transport system substrate-binding protein